MADENLQLEENQVKEHTDKLSEYSVCVEGAGAPQVVGPKLTATKPGIRLHFSRYGLFPNNAKDQSQPNRLISGHLGQQSETIEEVFPEGVPPVEGFFYAKTYLNAGYVYIMDEGNPNLWYEYEVDDLGNLSSILWANNKSSDGKYLDIRTSSGKIVSDKTFKKGTVLWIAYSPVQWSIDYHTLIRTDTQRREERMVKVECTGFERGAESSTNFITPFDNTHNAFFSENKAQPFWFNNKLKEIIADDNAALEKDPQSIKEDMFITLHSPLACAKDIYYHLDEKFLYFKAYVDALQTGETIEEVKERYKSEIYEPIQIDSEYQSLFMLALTCYKLVYENKENIEKYDGGAPGWNMSDTNYPREYAKQQELDKIRKANSRSVGGYGNGYMELGKAMQSTQQRDPNRIYPEFIGYGIDRAKVEGILGVSERKELRDELNTLRDIYGDFITSEYVKKSLDDYLHNCPEGTLDGKAGLMQLVNALLVCPSDVDNALLLEKEKPGTVDKWNDFVYNYTDTYEEPDESKNSSVKSKAPGFTGSDPLYALLSGALNITALTKVNYTDISAKLSSVYKIRLDAQKKRVFDFKYHSRNGTTYKTVNEKVEFLFKRLKRDVHVYGEHSFEIRNGELNMRLNAMEATLDPNFVKYGKYRGKEDVSRILYGSTDVEIKQVQRGANIVEMPVIKNGAEIAPDQLVQNDKNVKAGQLLDSKAFNGVLTGLQILNFGVAVNDAFNDYNAQNLVNAAGIGSDLAEAGTRLRMSFVRQNAKMVTNVKELKLLNLGKQVKFFGAVGGGVTAAICFADSYQAMKVRDTDSSIAYAAAGVTFAASTLIPLIWATSSVAGPIGWIGALLGTGFIVLAATLKDSDLEKYFKNFLLSDAVAFSNSDKKFPVEYSKDILADKELLMDDANEDIKAIWMEPQDALISLYDIIVCPFINFKPTEKRSNTYTTPASYGPGGVSVPSTSITQQFYAFELEMTFLQFVDLNSNMHDGYKLYLYPRGIKNGNEIPLEKALININQVDNNPSKLKLKFTIPNKVRNMVSTSSEVLFALQVINKNAPGFPLILNNKERHMGVKFDLGDVGVGITLLFMKEEQTEKVKILPLDDLRKADTWK
ncbi:hypothetical protein L3049_14355 [Labilibaculum sp. DW002]|uniref:Toxin VasX N-terminal region domain-containing protein n=1 Tax=Paralabilibaculum antarcticum TaxID=2912572 RepID=A0ABT5VUS6_9BACT|nr:toxin VasX [Labilibaculum sp. DW002]MDE5419179.1 hypothetical protein [Labilibaculum sp. DW002]